MSVEIRDASYESNAEAKARLAIERGSLKIDLGIAERSAQFQLAGQIRQDIADIERELAEIASAQERLF